MSTPDEPIPVVHKREDFPGASSAKDQMTKRAVAATVAHGTRLDRARKGVRLWEIIETVPGTFRVITTSGGDYAVQYYSEAGCWTCDCEDFTLGQAHHFGVPCKHILGVREYSHHLVDPATGIPLSLGQGLERQDHTLPANSSSHEKEYTMNESTFNAATVAALSAPFPVEAHSFKPGATTRDNSRALALTYVDPRLYQARLDEVDPAWQSQYQVHALDDRILVNCTLTVCGVTREDVGECLLYTKSRGTAVPEENAYTSAVAQAFKRVCAQFGLGRYLYDLPKVWASYDQSKRRFDDAGMQSLRSSLAQAIGVSPAGSKQRRKQPDRPQTASSPQPPSSNGKATSEQIASIRSLLGALGYQESDYGGALQRAGFVPFDKLTGDQADQAIERLEAARAKKDQPAPIDEVKKTYIKGLLATLGHETDEAQDKALAQAGFPALDELTADQAEPLIERLEAAKEKAVPAGNGRQ